VAVLTTSTPVAAVEEVEDTQEQTVTQLLLEQVTLIKWDLEVLAKEQH
jgi:hypothetical protein